MTLARRLTAPATTALLAASMLAGAGATIAAPGDGTIAFLRWVADEGHLVIVRPDGSGEREIVIPSPGYLPVWSADGARLIVTVFTEDSLRPMVVDPSTGATTILDVPDADPDLALLCRSWSPDGERIFCQGDSLSATNPEINGAYSIASDGSDIQRLTTDAYPPIFTDRGTCGGGDMPGEPSPDGMQLLVTRARCGGGPVPDRNQRAALFIVDTDGTNFRQITPYGIPWSHDSGIARWSPDGNLILFAGANGDLFTIRPDGSEQHRIRLDLGGDKGFALAPDWSPYGTRIVFNLFLRDGVSGIYTSAADGSDVTLVLAFDGFFGDYPTWGAADY
jgi:Tol biopolymer transport system component